MKIKFIVIFILMFCFFPYLSQADEIGTTDNEVQQIAEPVLEGIMEGFETNDYALYSKDFDDTLIEAVSEKKFQEVDSHFEGTIGELQHKDYLGFLTKGKMTVILWKARFDKSEDDVLIKLIMSKRGDRYVVTGLWFQ